MPVLPPKYFWSVCSDLHACDHLLSPQPIISSESLIQILPSFLHVVLSLPPVFSTSFLEMSWISRQFSSEGWFDVWGQKNLSEAIHLIMCFLWPHSAAQVQIWYSWQRFGVSILPDKYNGRRDGQGIWIQENGFKWCVMEFKLRKEGSKGMRRQ